MKIKVTLHETESVTGAPYNIKVTVCHTAEHYGEEYDDWNCAVFRSQRMGQTDRLTDGQPG